MAKAAAIAAVTWIGWAGRMPAVAPARYVLADLEASKSGFELRLFPADGAAKMPAIPLPNVLPRWFGYNAAGRALYVTTVAEIAPNSYTLVKGISKIEFNPVRVTPLPGFDSFDPIDRFAVSQQQDKIVFSAIRPAEKGSRKCGIYEMRLPEGTTRTVTETSECRAGSPLRVLSLTPAGDEALLLEGRSLVQLSLAGPEATPVEGTFAGGSISPDGKWIAALELIGTPLRSHTVLIDRQHPDIRRDLGGLNDAEAVWSPDSRFIAHAVPRPACLGLSPLALETINVRTGQRTLLKNTICRAGAGRVFGWMPDDIAK